MARRETVNRTGLERLSGKPIHDAWIGFVCLRCKHHNTLHVGGKLINPADAYEHAEWRCGACRFLHSRKSALPFPGWPKGFVAPKSIQAQRFWLGFFRIATEHPTSYWKWCNTCGRVLPFAAFSRHARWGPLERQMECRSCKGSINAKLNPMRTTEQLREGARRRRAAELLLVGEDQHISVEELFRRFDSKCFKTGRRLNINQPKTWAIDHILPSAYLYPLSVENAALLSVEANANKRDRWPSDFYDSNELINLCRITGANLELLSRREPIVNPHIDVNACVERSLTVRSKTNLAKRIQSLKWLLSNYNLVSTLTDGNKKMLGLN